MFTEQNNFPRPDFSKLTVDQLSRVKMNLAEMLHGHLDRLSQVGFQGLVLADYLSPGKIGDALAANDGSSHYLRGIYLPQLKINPSLISTTQKVSDFLTEQQLPSELILGNIAMPFGCCSFISHGARLIHSFSAGVHSSNLICEQEYSAINSLVLLAEYLNRLDASCCTKEEVAECYAASKLYKDLRVTEAQLINALNQNVWSELLPILEYENIGKISVGESFTFGKLGALFSSLPQRDSIVDLVYGWYDPSYKAAVGVPRELLTEELIAEANTMEVAARGLFSLCSEETNITIATSGRANNWEAGADYFSIALAKKGGDVISRKYRVLKTEEDPKDRTRREITRALGVSASLLLLTEIVDNPRITLNVKKQLQEVLDLYACA